MFIILHVFQEQGTLLNCPDLVRFIPRHSVVFIAVMNVFCLFLTLVNVYI